MAEKLLKRKKTQMSQEALDKRVSIMRTALALGIGVLLSIVIIFIVSDSPLESVGYLLAGPIMNLNNFYSMISMWVPIVITGLAICIMFSANQFNLFAEGAFFFGGVMATIAALVVKLPAGIHPVVCILAAAVVCALLGAIPALMRYKLDASEMVGSMLLNYAILRVGLFLISYFFRDESAGSVVSKVIPATARLSKLVPRSNINVGIFIAIILTVITYFLIYKTRWGYQIRLTGQNKEFAKYAGISIGFVTIFSQMLGSAFAGAAGAIEVLGQYSRFSWTNLTGHGWDGVTLGIIANRNPKYIPAAALFLAYLRKGADLMSIKTGMQTDFVSIIQAVILVFLLAENLLSKYKQKKTVQLSKQLEAAHLMEGGAGRE